MNPGRALSLFLSIVATACLDPGVCSECGPIGGGENQKQASQAGLTTLVTNNRVSKVDMLLVIDGSASMGDKQELFAKAVPSLVARLVRPFCVDAAGALTGEQSEAGRCSVGQPEFAAVPDIHVGVISSNLGAGGGDACAGAEYPDDRAWLIPKVRAELASDPAFGGGVLGWTASSGVSMETMTQNVQRAVRAVGERGCGYEQVLESWYRFLVEPEPRAGTGEVSAAASATLDDELLAQRAAFLRPDSLVLIVALSDENDCSLASGANSWQSGQASAPDDAGQEYHLARGTAACGVDPASACCRPCSDTGMTPTGCAPVEGDAECEKGRYTIDEDPINLRCFDQKRRFGTDFRTPISRYLRGLTAQTVPDASGREVPNPLLVSPTAIVRGRGRVTFVTIGGVPWQDLAAPESIEGGPLRLLSQRALEAEGRWPLMLASVPGDPHMIESASARIGAHPYVRSATLVAPEQADGWDVINGREHAVFGELQYACMFPLDPPRVCVPSDTACTCGAAGVAGRSPACVAPDGAFGSTQYFAPAKPGVRQLELVQQLGALGVAGSVCPNGVTTLAESDPSYGYNPTMTATVEQLKPALADQCLPEASWLDAEGDLSCLVVEVQPQAACDCTLPGRKALAPGLVKLMVDYIQSEQECDGQNDTGLCGDLCGCTLDEAKGAERVACQTERDKASLDPGYCYVDATSPESAEVVSNCPASSAGLLRVVGPETPLPGSTLAVICLVNE